MVILGLFKFENLLVFFDTPILKNVLPDSFIIRVQTTLQHTGNLGMMSH